MITCHVPLIQPLSNYLLFLHSSTQLELRLIILLRLVEMQLIIVTNEKGLTVESEWLLFPPTSSFSLPIHCSMGR